MIIDPIEPESKRDRVKVTKRKRMINWSYFGYLRIVSRASSSRRVPISKIKTNAQENCKLANANSNSNPNSNSARKRRGNLVTEGGNGNWSCDPRAQPYHSDGGVHREREGETRQRSERKEKKERSRSLIGELDRSASLVSLSLSLSLSLSCNVLKRVRALHL